MSRSTTRAGVSISETCMFTMLAYTCVFAMTPAALGFRAHSGWAAMVAVSGPAPVPVVLDRCRVPLIEPGVPGAAQPYHFAAEMALKDAQRHLDHCARTAREMACSALQAAIAGLA